VKWKAIGRSDSFSAVWLDSSGCSGSFSGPGSGPSFTSFGSVSDQGMYGINPAFLSLTTITFGRIPISIPRIGSGRVAFPRFCTDGWGKRADLSGDKKGAEREYGNQWRPSGD
jgi:hypothetical protein